MNYLIGADPELFIFRKDTNQFVSSHDSGLKGDKINPFPVTDGATQIDGVSAEFNILPCASEQEFVGRIRTVKGAISAQITEKHPDWNFELRAEPVAHFEPTYFESLPEDTKALGCTPDYNAYTGDQNDPPYTAEPFRTGSGHVHVGYDLPTQLAEYDVMARVKQLDYILFPISLLFDDNQKRRSLYGMPGAFRYKPYGFEYRVLSNRWVDDEELQRWVYRTTLHAMDLFDRGIELFETDAPPLLEYTREELHSYLTILEDQYGFPPFPIKFL